MSHTEVIRDFDNATLCEHYREVSNVRKRLSVGAHAPWLAFDAISREVEAEMAHRNIGHDGRPLAPVNVSALVD